ncbi:hypothetical protein B0T19DRAFT_116752 [Cercophora scortea]|uniref:Secreted protein n=1 Tax=Cercophora scortea TaxID=314031 RepID=A0AAE0IY80_9PEZI|nr:hypothetical protein B0T19DRAFT_116752 [Cercophora scortea]
MGGCFYSILFFFLWFLFSSSSSNIRYIRACRYPPLSSFVRIIQQKHDCVCHLFTSALFPPPETNTYLEKEQSVGTKGSSWIDQIGGHEIRIYAVPGCLGICR